MAEQKNLKFGGFLNGNNIEGYFIEQDKISFVKEL